MSDKEEIIRQYYYDPQIGFQSAWKLYKKLKDGKEVTYKDVQNFISRQEVHQLTQQVKEPKEFNTITATYPLECVQMDIMVYDRFTFHNYNNIICCVDVYSRFAICRALTSRKISAIVEKLEEMFKDTGFPKNINCDQEFNVKDVNEFAKKHNITMWYSQPYEINKNAIVERFNRTLAQLLQNWRTATKEYDWYRVLPDIVKNYNTNHHSTIRSNPTAGL